MILTSKGHRSSRLRGIAFSKRPVAPDRLLSDRSDVGIILQHLRPTCDNQTGNDPRADSASASQRKRYVGKWLRAHPLVGASCGYADHAGGGSDPLDRCQPAINCSMAPWVSSSAVAGTELGSCPKAERREMPYTVAQATAARRRTSSSGVPSGWQAAIVSWSRFQYWIAAPAVGDGRSWRRWARSRGRGRAAARG